jgi:hypothetical protein
MAKIIITQAEADAVISALSAIAVDGMVYA